MHIMRIHFRVRETLLSVSKGRMLKVHTMTISALLRNHLVKRAAHGLWEALTLTTLVAALSVWLIVSANV